MASFWIEYEQGGEVRQTSFESESISIGRDRSSDFILDHPTVSRQHALVVHQGGGNFQLIVLSRGGLTAVDRTPVEGEVPLYDGSQVTLGKYTVRFRSHQAAPKPQGRQQQGSGVGAIGVSSPPSTPQAKEEKEEKKKDDGPGIMTWDEIAATSERDALEGVEVEQEMTNFQRIQEAKKKKEGSNPIVIVAGLMGAALLLLFALSGDGDSGSVVETERRPFEEQEPVVISVTCIDPSACEQEAEHNYQRGVDLLEQRAVETGNLFEGYHRLLLTQAYLEEAGIAQIPDEMDQWQELHDMARADLDARFQELRMRFHQAAQRNQHREMANILREIEAYFPERTARENRWARNRETQMKAQGIYPRN